jgi:hypothetical protein
MQGPGLSRRKARVRGCSRLRQGADGCRRCRHGCRQRYERTFRSRGAIQRSRIVVSRSLMCHLAASTVAHGRPASLISCLRWLPFWLPASGNPAVIGLHVSGLADSVGRDCAWLFRAVKPEAAAWPGWPVSRATADHRLPQAEAAPSDGRVTSGPVQAAMPGVSTPPGRLPGTRPSQTRRARAWPRPCGTTTRTR